MYLIVIIAYMYVQLSHSWRLNPKRLCFSEVNQSDTSSLRVLTLKKQLVSFAN